MGLNVICNCNFVIEGENLQDALLSRINLFDNKTKYVYDLDKKYFKPIFSPDKAYLNILRIWLLVSLERAYTHKENK